MYHVNLRLKTIREIQLYTSIEEIHNAMIITLLHGII